MTTEMAHDQHQGSQTDKQGKEQKEQSRKGPGQDAHQSKPDQQKNTDQQKKEEHRHQTGR
jgi:hypothetical protein